MVLPNTFLIGVQKGGTSSLYDSLSKHTDILAPQLAKDYHYFAYEQNYKKGLSELSSFYSNNNDQKIVLNAAVNYIYFPDTIRRLKEYKSDSKLIVVFRNPIHRAVSAYKDFYRLGMETRSFEAAIKEEKADSKPVTENDKDHAYLKHGLYQQQVLNVLDHFKKEQLHILFFEDLIADPLSEFKKIFTFLEIDTDLNLKLSKNNQSVEPRFKWFNELILGKNGFKSFLKSLGIHKMISAKTYQSIFQFIRNKNVTSSKIDFNINKSTHTELAKYYGPTVSRLSSIVGRDLAQIWPEFKSTH